MSLNIITYYKENFHHSHAANMAKEFAVNPITIINWERDNGTIPHIVTKYIKASIQNKDLRNELKEISAEYGSLTSRVLALTHCLRLDIRVDTPKLKEVI